jgi:hypothetical protein
LAARLKNLSISIFVSVNIFANIIFIVAISDTTNGGTISVFATITFMVNFVVGFFLPLFASTKNKN